MTGQQTASPAYLGPKQAWGLGARVASAIVGLPLLALAVWYGGPTLTAVVAFVSIIAAYEFFSMGRQAGAAPISLALLYAPLFAINAWRGNAHPELVVTGALVLPLAWLALRFQGARSFQSWAWTTMGLLYAGWLPAYAVLLRLGTHGKGWLFVAVFGCFAVDTAAYFVGKLFGRHKMAPSISPGKTWEGAVGGLLGGMLGAWVVSLPFDFISSGEAVVAGAVIAVVAQVGDLAESMLKRSADVKDAGRLIPGHGGILDRLDSQVFAIPVIYYFFQ